MYQQDIRPIIESGITNMVLKATELDSQPLLYSIQELCTISEQEIGHELHLVEMVCKIWRHLLARISQEKTAYLSVGNKVQEKRVKEILSYIHTHFSKHISIDDLSRYAAISRTECFRSFQAVLGKSPVEYLTEYRLSMASAMLANSEKTLADISYSCGFNSPSYFGKLFRQQRGMTPKQYRELMKNKI